MSQTPLPKELLDLHLRLDALERKIGKASIASVPNQNLSVGSDVEFNSILIGLRGVWTPAFAGTTIAGVFTYTIQDGYYFVLSNNIVLYGRVAISAIPTPPTGNMRITGLPFPSHATITSGGICFTSISNFNYAANAIELKARTGSGVQFVDIREVFDNGAEVSVPAANFTNVACELRFFGLYMGA